MTITEEDIQRILRGELSEKVAKFRQIEESLGTNKRLISPESLEEITKWIRVINGSLHGEAKVISEISRVRGNETLEQFKVRVASDLFQFESREKDAIVVLKRIFGRWTGIRGIPRSIKKHMKELFGEYLALSKEAYVRDHRLLNALRT